MKRAALAFLLIAPLAHAQEDDLERARFFDRQGVRAFTDGHYRDAMALFNESYRSGGPPTELWNVARCQLKLEDTGGAAETLANYLSKKNLAEDDRNEAKRLLDDIERRSSTFVVASSPTGAVVVVDGHSVGITPFASTLPPGEHDVRVARDAGSFTKKVEAHYGRPIVLSVTLEDDEKSTPRTPPRKHALQRLSIELTALGAVSSLGGAAVIVSPAAQLAVGYAPFASRRLLLGFGLRFQVAGDVWTSSSGVSNTVAGCALPTDYYAAELTIMPTVYGAWHLGAFALGAHVGFGAAFYASGSPIGGDLFLPSCSFGGAASPDVYAGLDVSLRATRALRLVLVPASFDIHGSYDAARTGGPDATSAWVRFGFGFGAAVDL